MNELDQLLEQLKNPANLSNPTWLSDTAVRLSILLYNLGDEVAHAELLEVESAQRFLDEIPLEGKKTSVAEAEKRAQVETRNEYTRLRFRYQSLVEVIQSTKKKIDSTTQQIKAGI